MKLRALGRLHLRKDLISQKEGGLRKFKSLMGRVDFVIPLREIFSRKGAKAQRKKRFLIRRLQVEEDVN